MTRHWIAVASADHVRRGLKGGFMQVCHGKIAPLNRIEAGDHVAYYSPTEILGSKDGLQSFTAIGTVKTGDLYNFDMGNGFVPSRRDVDWDEAHTASIRPLLDKLEFTAGRPNWGAQLRFGLLQISAGDFALIEAAVKNKTAP
ncbi:EVE domain-containing protein [Phyllobacterium sp. CL33Tsu]|uniref:EVE domain-containing protein n=1 Tax=Phyllobacterium sp. CL33Tsu TaxID=1798191 RepID=UPI0008EA8A76|nr:EVE domain-containing protein [Phyllobacterium sp. CL33Tsu]SFI53207.1 EVE domain-containing protein [Phyllobacterium sp. CL33Tsu]